MIVRFALALALAAALSGVTGSRLAAAEPAPAEAPRVAGSAPSAPQPAASLDLGNPTPRAAVAATAASDNGAAPRVPRPVPTIEPAPDGDGFTLSADFEVPLTRSLEDAVNRGVPLYFVIEFELYRPRWYWYDERVVERSRTWRLAHHALTRQYRVTVNGVIHPFEKLEDALDSIVRVHNWRVVSDADELQPGVAYDAQVRLRLDTSQLPKPFQIRGLTNRDWNPQVEWKRFTFTLPTPKSAR